MTVANPTKVPGLSSDVVDIENMTKVTKTYDNGNTVELYAAAYCNECTIKNARCEKFFNHGGRSRPSYSYHRSGVVTGNTDNFCCDAPVRRRSAYLFVWSESDKSWDLWCLGSVNSIAQGKRLIDRVLDTGKL